MVSKAESKPVVAQPLADAVFTFDVPLADLTLRAGTDGATVRVHRGTLGLHSRVFLEALTAPASPPEELPLPGKSINDLKLLTAYMYPRRSRDETFSASSIGRFCELGREYDMTELLAAAGEWLNARAADLVLSPSVSPQHVTPFLKLMQLAHDFNFPRFFELGMTSWAEYSSKQQALEACAEAARHLDSEVLFRLLSSACKHFQSEIRQARENYLPEQRRYGY
jgi:hypothetical protein